MNRKMNNILNCITIVLTLIRLGFALDASLSTGFTGGFRAAGNIFEIATKGDPVTVTRLDINADAIVGPIEVWYRPGTVSPSYDESYLLALSVEITGSGKGNITSLPAFTNPIVMPNGSSYTIYVTAAINDALTIWYDTGTQLGDVFAFDDYLEVKDGYAVGYPFKGTTNPRRWNGIIHYSISGDGPTTSPTKLTVNPAGSNAPTVRPTNIPTVSPSSKNSAAPTKLQTSGSTSSPSNSPIRVSTETPSPKPVSPTLPTHRPTSSPTRPADTSPNPIAQTTSSPVKSVIESTHPTLNPTLGPTSLSEILLPANPTSSVQHSVTTGFIYLYFISFLLGSWSFTPW